MTPLLHAYGLSISSEFPLPELGASTCTQHQPAEPDVRIARGADLEPGTFESACNVMHADSRVGVLGWRGVGRFTLSQGRHILVEPEAGASEDAVRDFLLGAALPTLLFQRGFLVLHASAVALPDSSGGWQAVAFVGNSGRGKSTLAAALHAQGCPVVADDYIAVPPPDASTLTDALSARGPLIWPGFSHLRLLPPSLASLGVEAPAPEPGRKALHGVGTFGSGQLPLRRVYVLEPGPEILIRPVPPARSIVELARHSYCVSLFSPEESAAQFGRCGSLARSISTLSLQRPRDLARLGDLAQAIEEDAGLK